MLTWIIGLLIICAINTLILGFLEVICSILYLIFRGLAEVMPYVFAAVCLVFSGVIKMIIKIFDYIIMFFEKKGSKSRKKKHNTDKYERYHDCEVVWDSKKKCYVPK